MAYMAQWRISLSELRGVMFSSGQVRKSDQNCVLDESDGSGESNAIRYGGWWTSVAGSTLPQ